MTCAQARTMADAYLSSELPVDTSLQLNAHLERCAACREEFDARAGLRRSLRAAFLADTALAPDAALAARVRARLDAGRRPARHWYPRGGSLWAIAAGLMLVAALGWQWVVIERRAPGALAALVGYAAGDHRDCALQHALEQAPISLDEAARRYDPRYATLSAAVEGSAPVLDGTVSFVGAHWCVFRGRAFAHVVVRHRGAIVSILLTPEQLATSAEPAVPCPSSDGFTVSCFATAGHAAFVVSALPASDSLELARAVAPVLHAHFERG